MTDIDSYAKPGVRKKYSPVSAWFFPHPVAWIICTVLFFVEAVWIYWAGVDFILGSAWKLTLVVGFLIAAGALLAKANRDESAILVFSIAFIILFGKQMNVLNYLSLAIGMPWADAIFASADRALGFDWLALLALFNDSPRTAGWIYTVYNLLGTLMALTAVSLWVMGKFERLREYIFIFAVTGFVTIVIGALLPAGGTFFFYQPATEILANLPPEPGRFFLEHLVPVRNGELNIINMDQLAGLVTFPSFHTIMALAMTWAVRNTVVFWPFAAINLVLLIGTPVFGGHYLSDMLAGGVVFMFAAMLYYRLAGRTIGMQHIDRPFRLSS